MVMPTLTRAEEAVGVANRPNRQRIIIEKVLIVFISRIVIIINEFYNATNVRQLQPQNVTQLRKQVTSFTHSEEEVRGKE